MAYKILVNNTGVDIQVRLIERQGDDPANTGGKVDVKVAKGATVRQDYGGPFLNGVRIKTETDGKATAKLQTVTVRGSAWDDTLNTNDTLTIGTKPGMNITGSNS